MAPRASFTSRIFVILIDRTGKRPDASWGGNSSQFGKLRLVEQALVLTCKEAEKSLSNGAGSPFSCARPPGSRRPRAAPGQSSAKKKPTLHGHAPPFAALFRSARLSRRSLCPHRVDEGAERGNAVL